LPDVLDSLETAARVRAPLLVEHGSQDGLFPTAWAEKLAAAHPGAELAIVKGMHHADPVAHPSPASWEPVIRFVKQTPAASVRSSRCSRPSPARSPPAPGKVLEKSIDTPEDSARAGRRARTSARWR